MNRRRLLKLSGLVAAGGSFSLGTGAFTSASAQRRVDIAVADDDSAYLALNDTSEIARSYDYGDPEEIAFAIPSLQEDTIGDGVGQNSVYEFSGLLEITNQGDDTVVVWSESGSTDAIKSVSLTGPNQVLNSKQNSVELSPGEGFSTGLLIETKNKTGEFETSVVIKTEKPNVDESFDRPE